MEKNNLVAIQYCTHNHPDVVEYVLANSAEWYKNAGIDVYFFDSSDNEETKKIVEEFTSKGFSNIFHVRLDPSMNVYSKLDMIFSGEGMRKDYKYVWPSKDRVYLSEEKLGELITLAEKDYDAIYIAMGDIPKYEYTSPEEFYYINGSVAASLNVTIYNRKTLLKNYRRITDAEAIPFFKRAFFQFYVLFDSLVQIEDPRIRILELGEGDIHFTPGASSLWIKDTIEVYKDGWIDVNDSLPSRYDPYKDKVIREGAGFRHILAHRDRLRELHDMGVVTPETLDRVLDRWERVSYIPKSVVTDIAYGRYDMKYDLSMIKTDNKTVNILIEMSQYIKEGKMQPEQIPINDISSVVFEEIVKRSDDEVKRNIVLGAVDSILLEMRESELTGKRATNLLQQIIAYLL